MFTASRISRIILALAALALAATIAVAVPPSAAAAAQWQSYETDGDRWRTCDPGRRLQRLCRAGLVRRRQRLPLGHSPLQHPWRRRLHEEIAFDMDENNVPEYLMQDVDQRTGFE